ncbi:hypothetical protein DFP72DRAFT_1079477 [Ephemerocybe angulata]|uniref:Integrase core domain-containing protein n=1 Tax=Ephemerocybe angulata TaxID=980116 RepID=A0A8H6HB72_9AGAR|nr:hypothetical protein DFP72DRAFT_1079477 [Tulosesus angulatus]
MPNPSGNNQWGAKSYPDDEDLRSALMECARQSLSVSDTLTYLRKKLDFDIKKSTLMTLKNRLDIPSVRKPRVSDEALDNAAKDLIIKDVSQGNGPNAIKAMLRVEYIMIPRDRIRALFRSIAPEGAEKRAPGYKHTQIYRVPLMAYGPFHEISADGHEKLNAQALRMGDINFPIYAYRDKWSGYLLKIAVLPNTRTAAAIGHLYLDLVSEYGGIPIQVTTDKGSEIGWQATIQEAFRILCAPGISLDEYPSCVALKSVHNTVIESLWRWFESKTGHNLKALILRGMKDHIFHPHRSNHTDLFYWIFVPLIQGELDKFQLYWNYHRIRAQEDKLMPSNHIPAVLFSNPEKHNGTNLNCLIKVNSELVENARKELEDEVGPRDEHLKSWLHRGFRRQGKGMLWLCYGSIGSPALSIDTAWDVFQRMSAALNHAD